MLNELWIKIMWLIQHVTAFTNNLTERTQHELSLSTACICIRRSIIPLFFQKKNETHAFHRRPFGLDLPKRLSCKWTSKMTELPVPADQRLIVFVHFVPMRMNPCACSSAAASSAAARRLRRYLCWFFRLFCSEVMAHQSTICNFFFLFNLLLCFSEGATSASGLSWQQHSQSEEPSLKIYSSVLDARH